MLNINDIKALEPDRLSGYIFATLKDGKEVKIKIEKDKDYDTEYTRLKSKVYGKVEFEEVIGFNGKIKGRHSKKFYIEEGTKKPLTARQVCDAKGWELGKFNSTVYKTGQYKGIRFEVTVWTGEEHVKREWKSTIGYKYLRVEDKREFTLKQVEQELGWNKTSFGCMVRRYGEYRGVKFLITINGVIQDRKFETMTFNKKSYEITELETGITYTGFAELAKKYGWARSYCSRMILKHGEYKGIKFIAREV